jgi:hypothetical protein
MHVTYLLRKHCGHLPMVSAGLVSHQMNSLARRSGFPPSKNSFHMSSFFCPLDLGILTKIPMPPVTNTHNPASTHTHGNPYGALQDSIRLTYRRLIISSLQPPSAETLSKQVCFRPTPLGNFFAPEFHTLFCSPDAGRVRLL